MIQWTIIPLASVVCYSVLLVVNFWRGQRNRANSWFSLYLLSMILWSLGSFHAHLEQAPEKTLLLNRLMLFGSVGMPISFFGFVQFFLGKDRKRWLVFGWILYLVIQIANMLGYVIRSAYVSNGRLINVYGPALFLPSLSWVLFIGFSAWDLSQAFRKTKDVIYRNRIKYLFTAIIVIFIGSITNSTPRLGVYPIDIGFNVVSAFLIAYAILRFHLLDLSVFIRKSLLYSIPTLVLWGIYFLVFYLIWHMISSNNNLYLFIVSLLVSIFGALVAQPFRDKIQLWVDKLFFREKHDLGLLLQNISQNVASVLDINELTNIILKEVSGQFHLLNSAFFLKEVGHNNFRLSTCLGLETDLTLELKNDHPIVMWLESHTGVLSKMDIDITPQFLSLMGQERDELDRLSAELFVPVKSKGILVGILTVGAKSSEETFSLEDQETLITLANQTAVAIENARLYAEAKDRTQEMVRLNTALEGELFERERAEKELGISEERFRRLAENAPDLIYRIAVEKGYEFISSAAKEILGFAPEAFYQDPGLITKFIHPHDRLIFQELIQGNIRKGPIVIRWIKDDESIVWLEEHNVPLYDQTGKLLAIEGVARDITKRKQYEVELAARINQLEKYNQEINTINEMGEILQTCTSREEAYPVITKFLQQFFPGISGAIQIILPSKIGFVETVGIWGVKMFTNGACAVGECKALRDCKPYLTHKHITQSLCTHVNYSKVKTHLCIPLMAQGEPLGLLTLAIPVVGKEQGNLNETFTESQQQLTTTIAEHIALALANLRLSETLREQAIRDPLTELFNRRYMEETLERELSRAKRKQNHLALIFMDIDYFKQYNDRFGHDAGDLVLKALGGFLEEHIRKEDVACRMGGEEFVLILPDTSLDVACQRAEEICRSIKKLNIQYLDSVLKPITLSLGVSVFPEHGSTPNALLHAADLALYRAKEEGRDRLKVAEVR